MERRLHLLENEIIRTTYGSHLLSCSHQELKNRFSFLSCGIDLLVAKMTALESQLNTLTLVSKSNSEVGGLDSNYNLSNIDKHLNHVLEDLGVNVSMYDKIEVHKFKAKGRLMRVMVKLVKHKDG